MRVVVLGLLLGATVLSAQEPQVFRSRIDLVQIEVVVTDGEGRPVRGLTSDDFKLFDRRKPQAISVFHELRHDAPDAPALFPPELKLDVADNRYGPSERLVVMVIDDWNIWKERTEHVKDLAKKIIADLSPRASMALLYTSRTGSTEVTQDRAELLAAVDRFKGRKMVRRPGAWCGGACGIGMVMQIAGTRTLEDAARFIRGNDGRRKAFVFVSEKPPVARGPSLEELRNDINEDSFLQFEIRRLMQALHETNVAVYALDPRGHITNQELGAECFPPPPPTRNPGASLNFDDCTGDAFGLPPGGGTLRGTQRGLESFAETTGGFGIVNTDDFSAGINRIVEALDNYYLLGFYPADMKGSGFRPVKVMVNRPGLTVRYRRGYLPPPKPKTPKKTDAAGELLAGVLPRTELPMRVFATALPTAKKEARVLVWTEVTVPRGRLLDAAGKLRDEVQHLVVAGDMNVGKVKKQARRVVTINGTSTGADPGAPFTYQIASELLLPKGRYQIRASALSGKLAQGGSVYQTLDVPDFRSDAGAISQIVVGASRGGVHTEGSPPGIPFQPTLAREFSTSDVLRLYMELSRKPGSAAAGPFFEVLDSRGTRMEGYSSKAHVIDGRRSSASLELPLAGFGAGAYRLRATVQGEKGPATREVGIVVTPAPSREKGEGTRENLTSRSSDLVRPTDTIDAWRPCADCFPCWHC